MMDIEIKGTSYPLKFGMGFLKDINNTRIIPIEGAPGMTEKVGLRYAIGMLVDGDLETLESVLLIANKTETPRLNMAILDDYIEDEATDIDLLFGRVMGFLDQANVSRKMYRQIMEQVDKQRAEANL